MPLYPGTGHAHETGGYANVMNCPLPDGAGGKAFRAVMEAEILPAIDRWAPDFLLISAGFDAHKADPCGDDSHGRRLCLGYATTV